MLWFILLAIVGIACLGLTVFATFNDYYHWF